MRYPRANQVREVIFNCYFLALLHAGNIENLHINLPNVVVITRYLVSQGCIKPLCDLLVCPDSRIVAVCLEVLENFLKVGEAEKNFGNTGDVNLYAQMIDNNEGLEKIEHLRSHDNSEIYEKAVNILETYWLEDEVETLPTDNASQPGFNYGGSDFLAPPDRFNFSRM